MSSKSEGASSGLFEVGTPTLILFGFEPFGDEPVNPSGEAVKRFHRACFGAVRVRGVVLPVTYGGAYETLARAVAALGRPRAVLGVGQGRGQFAVERRARNRITPGLVDNAGETRAGAIEPSGPEVLDASLDVDALFSAVRASVAGRADVVLSDDAGGYLCNHTYYRALRAAGAPAAFLHVPLLSVAPQGVTDDAVGAALAALA